MNLPTKYNFVLVSILVFISLLGFACLYSCDGVSEDGEQGETPAPTMIPTPPPTPFQTPPPTTPPPTTPTSPGAKINWSPTSITQTISPGESTSIDVSFVTTKDLANVVAIVSHEIQPYVMVSPSSFSHVNAGKVKHLTITFSASIDAFLGTYKGTIQLNITEKNQSINATPLFVTVNIWNLQINTDGGYSFKFPPEWSILSEQQDEYLYTPELQEYLLKDEHYVPPTLIIRLVAKSPEISLEEFANSRNEGWYSEYFENRLITIDGRDALFFNDLQAITSRQPPLAAFIDLGDNVLLILGELEEETFLTILESFNFE